MVYLPIPANLLVTSNHLMISSKKSPNLFGLFYLTGIRVQTFPLNSTATTYSFNLSRSPKGIYTIVLQMGEAVRLRKSY